MSVSASRAHFRTSFTLLGWKLLLPGLAAFICLIGWCRDGHHPTAALPGSGWWGDYDQSHYIHAALSFAKGEFSSAEQWYLPLYPALAVPGVWLHLPDPFLPVNLICLMASVWIFGLLTRLVLPEFPSASFIGMAVFLLCEMGPPSIRQVWSTPWTSTLAVPFMLLAILFCLNWIRNPKPSFAFVTGLSTAIVGGGRPVDGALLLGACGCVVLLHILYHRDRRRSVIVCTLAILSLGAGIIVGALPTLILYFSVWGPHLAPYIISSQAVGFDLALLPLHWVEIMIAPEPALPSGHGIIQSLPFVLTGLTGLLFAGAIYRRPVDLLVLLAVSSSSVLYLAYRDLHAPGIWAFHNIHYFKWSLGFLGLYSIILLRLVVSNPRILFAVLPVMMLLVFWRAVPVSYGSFGYVTNGHTAVLDVPALHVTDSITLPATGESDQIYFGTHSLWIGTHQVLPIADFKAFPIPGGMMIQPLRAWVAGTLSITPVDGIAFTGPAQTGRIILKLGIPCWGNLGPWQCSAQTMLPPVSVPAGETITMVSPLGQQTSTAGWFGIEPEGRWINGRSGTLRFNVPVRSKLTFMLDANALWNVGMRPMTFSLTGREGTLCKWTWNDGERHHVDCEIPAKDIDSNGSVTLFLAVRTPHTPASVFQGSKDTRELGLFVHDFEWKPL
ncbi:hypothetical protein JK207_09355 [Gluconobacter cerinus]|uniref:hypothetical protein n=1 Tax=Gluconobacter TaxID=441 RepID=UPI001B8C5716|nr:MULTISPECIES: hypothetical protein [Gluconobacter]MBS0994392.1 hypothetical protein [Gluconobacter cerinus]MBS1022223.1 hypothetical protein [Gluconobacter cerinus]